VTRESAGNPFERISGARAFSHVQRLSLDPAEPRSADSPLAGQHQSYKSNSCILRKKPARDKESQAADCWAAVAKEIGWVGAAAYVLCSSPTLHDTLYSAQKSKPQHSGVTGAHASEAARCAWAPGRTDMLARAMTITRVDHLPRPHGMGGQGTSHCQTANMVAPVVGAEELPNPPSLYSLTTAEQAVVGMLCCGVRLYLVAAGHEDAQGVANCGASCSPDGSTWCVGTKIPFRFILHTFDGYFKHDFPDMDVSVSVCLLLKYTCICTRSNSWLHF